MSAAELLQGILPDERSAAFVTSAKSIRYLCGVWSEGAAAIISPEARYLFVNDDCPIKPDGFVVMQKDLKQMLDILVKFGIKRLFVENDKITAAELIMYKNALHYSSFIINGELSSALARLRSVKSEPEIEAVKKAQSVCDRAYQRLLTTIRKGMTERQIAAYLAFFLIEAGADEPAFPARALSGENSAVVGAVSGSRKVADGDFLLLDFGARVDGYCAKMARTVAVGKISSKQEDAYNALTCAVFDGFKALRAGISSNVPESVARTTLSVWNVEKFACGSFSEGIGLDAAEPLFSGESGSTTLRAGMTLSAGCDLRFKERYGLKITDTCVLTDSGYTNFTAATRELVHI